MRGLNATEPTSILASVANSGEHMVNDSSGHAPAKAGSPPRPRLAFRVGVVGHRPNRLLKANEPELCRVLSEVLDSVKTTVASAWDDSLYASSADRRIVLRAISPLAEGTDRLFATAALDLGYALCCVMPFPQAEFENDFAPASAQEPDALGGFRRLLDRASVDPEFTRYELDGDRSDIASAYGAAGRVVLNQSDLLVVVWDGQRTGKRGGTEETFEDAIARGVPAIWIDALNPTAWQLVDADHPLPLPSADGRTTPSPGTARNDITRTVRGLLEVPHPAGDEQRQSLQIYLSERKPKRSLAVLWRVFRHFLEHGRLTLPRLSIEDFEHAVEGEWPRDRSTPIARVVDRLRAYYAWSDTLAVLNADRYRSAFVLAYALAALAVAFALLPAGLMFRPHHLAEIFCIAGELGAIGWVLVLVYQGRRRQWHARWLDYRILAELIRHLRLVVPLGAVRPLPPIPAHRMKYGQPSATWMAWYVRAVERDLGLPSAVVDREFLQTALQQLIDVLRGQVGFHSTSSFRHQTLEHRLHRGGMILLWCTLVAGGLHFSASLFSWHVPLQFLAILTFCCGCFPAFGAALAGILNQGEFARNSKRSAAMKEQLGQLLGRVEQLGVQLDREPDRPTRQFSALVASHANQTAGLLVHEVLDWRVVFLDRPLTAPA